jgi:integrase
MTPRRSTSSARIASARTRSGPSGALTTRPRPRRGQGERRADPPAHVSQAFERLIEKAGLRKIRLHDLRVAHATLALKAGAPVKVISERLGHESPAFTLKQYAHVIPGMQAEAAAQVARLVDEHRRDV